MDNLENSESQSLLSHQETRSNRTWDLVKNIAFGVGIFCFIGGGIVAANELLKSKDGGNDLQLLDDQGGPLSLLQINGENSSPQRIAEDSANDSLLLPREDPLAYWLKKCQGSGQHAREHSRDFRVDEDCFSPLLSNEKAMGHIELVKNELIDCFRPLLSNEEQVACIASCVDRKTVKHLSLLLERQEAVDQIMQAARSCDQEQMNHYLCVFKNEQTVDHFNRILKKALKNSDGSPQPDDQKSEKGNIKQRNDLTIENAESQSFSDTITKIAWGAAGFVLFTLGVCCLEWGIKDLHPLDQAIARANYYNSIW